MEKFDLERFVRAQARDYETARRELLAGRKQSHWIWYIFPQLKGFGHSYESEYYGISGIEEAKAYLAHPVLGARLREVTDIMLSLPESDPRAVLGSGIDAKKFRSSMTLFRLAAPEEECFLLALEKYFGGVLDGLTVERTKGEA